MIFPLTVSIPLSSEALSSMKFPFQLSPNMPLAKARAQVVFPAPGEPANMRWDMFFASTYPFSLWVTSFWPMTSSSDLGLYFSVQISFMENIHAMASA